MSTLGNCDVHLFPKAARCHISLRIGTFFSHMLGSLERELPLNRVTFFPHACSLQIGSLSSHMLLTPDQVTSSHMLAHSESGHFLPTCCSLRIRSLLPTRLLTPNRVTFFPHACSLRIGSLSSHMLLTPDQVTSSHTLAHSELGHFLPTCCSLRIRSLLPTRLLTPNRGTFFPHACSL